MPLSGHLARVNESIQKVETPEGLVEFKCLLCGKISARRDTVTNHVETLHYPGSHQNAAIVHTFSLPETIGMCTLAESTNTHEM